MVCVSDRSEVKVDFYVLSLSPSIWLRYTSQKVRLPPITLRLACNFGRVPNDVPGRKVDRHHLNTV